MKNSNYIIGVIAAEVSSIEQRQILSGIVARAQEYRAQIVVLSNLYNPFDEDLADSTENRIYELIASDSFDALIFLPESFVNPALRRKILMQIRSRSELPVIFVGSELPEFAGCRFPHINTSDANDLEAVTDYLIDECGFRRISLLTGPLSMSISHARLNGYRHALEKHGIRYDPEMVIEGNFWHDAGRKLAKEYLSGVRDEPEALVCSNDYMAFGLLDAYAEAGEDITAHMAVIGYEFIPERNLHMPLLMTYQRNRTELGSSAVDVLVRRLNGEPEQPFVPPTGRLIGGQSCPCFHTAIHHNEELAAARLIRQYSEWNLSSGMESKLTECRSIEQFAEIMGEFLYLVRGAADIVLCLFEDWFRSAETVSRTLVCRNINIWADHTVYSAAQIQLPGIIRRYKKAAAGYVTPICFKERLLGYCMVWFERPDTYDEIYLHWLKSVANGLEFLRLKGDVRFLLQCRTLSPSYDSMTGVFSADGLRDAYQLMLNAQHPQKVMMVAFRFRYSQNALNTTHSAKETVSSLLAAVAVIKRFHGNGSIIGRISEYEILLICRGGGISAKELADAIHTEILYDADFIRLSDGVQDLMYGAEFSAETSDLSRCIGQMTDGLASLQEEQEQICRQPHYYELKALHDRLFRDPLCEARLKDAAEALMLNQNHFNRIYRQCFGVSFHRDHILAKMQLARHLLIATEQTVAGIAESCGYTDSKYFIRQFSDVTGFSPKLYRQTVRIYCG